ncbi:TIGR04219 family outer membrane beta-barrel protein [bacterium]|nr:TIGR04219 family outer membrane beta-barrel protein [bacterium]
MKKILTTILSTAILTTIVSADLSKVEMGAGVWMQTPKGDITYTESGANGSDVVNEKEENNNYIWMLIKHPIPVLPNLRLEYVNIDSTGIASGTFEDFTASDSKTSLKMTQFDVIPYYNILDNAAWITLDLGLDLKVVSLDYKAQDVTMGLSVNQNYSDTQTIIIPLAYMRARVEIPKTNIGLEADVKYVTYDGSTVSDIRAKVDYTLGFIPTIQPALEVGYRVQKIDISSSDVKSAMNVDFSGMYVGVMLRF